MKVLVKGVNEVVRVIASGTLKGCTSDNNTIGVGMYSNKLYNFPASDVVSVEGDHTALHPIGAQVSLTTEHGEVIVAKVVAHVEGFPHNHLCESVSEAGTFFLANGVEMRPYCEEAEPDEEDSEIAFCIAHLYIIE